MSTPEEITATDGGRKHGAPTINEFAIGKVNIVEIGMLLPRRNCRKNTELLGEVSRYFSHKKFVLPQRTE